VTASRIHRGFSYSRRSDERPELAHVAFSLLCRYFFAVSGRYSERKRFSEDVRRQIS
jgi:hypothetical protein